MEGLRLIRPTKEYEKQAIQYINEFIQYNSKIHGCGSLDKYVDDYDGWLNKVEKYRNMIPCIRQGGQ